MIAAGVLCDVRANDRDSGRGASLSGWRVLLTPLPAMRLLGRLVVARAHNRPRSELPRCACCHCSAHGPAGCAGSTPRVRNLPTPRLAIPPVSFVRANRQLRCWAHFDRTLQVGRRRTKQIPCAIRGKSSNPFTCVLERRNCTPVRIRGKGQRFSILLRTLGRRSSMQVSSDRLLHRTKTVSSQRPRWLHG